jgi:hypothetical protein
VGVLSSISRARGVSSTARFFGYCRYIVCSIRLEEMLQSFFDLFFSAAPGVMSYSFVALSVIFVIYLVFLSRIGIRIFPRIVFGAILMLALSIWSFSVAKNADGFAVLGGLGLMIIVGAKLPAVGLIGVLIANVALSVPKLKRLKKSELITLFIGPVILLTLLGSDLSARLLAYRGWNLEKYEGFLSSSQLMDHSVTMGLLLNSKAPNNMREVSAKLYLSDLFGKDPGPEQLADYFSRVSIQKLEQVTIVLECFKILRLTVAIPYLKEAAISPEKTWMSWSAVNTITAIGGPVAIEALRTILASSTPNGEARNTARNGLSTLGDLEGLLQNGTGDVTAQAIRELCKHSQDTALVKAGVAALFRLGHVDYAVHGGIWRNDLNSYAEILHQAIAEYTKGVSDRSQLQKFMDELVAAAPDTVSVKAAEKEIVPKLLPSETVRLDCEGKHREICSLLHLDKYPITDTHPIEGCSYQGWVKDPRSKEMRLVAGGGGMLIFDIDACLNVVKKELLRNCKSISPPPPKMMALILLRYTDVPNLPPWIFGKKQVLETSCPH